MKSLQQEAEEYAKITTNQMYRDELSFIAGATSKYVEQQKIEFAIKQLKQCMKKEHLLEVSRKIKELEKQLNN